MRCADLESLLSDYADGIADERARRIIERHIQLCRACYDSAIASRQIGQQLMRLSLLPLGIHDRAPRLRRRLEDRLTRRPALARSRVAMRASFALIFGVLGLLLLILVVSVGA